MCQFLEVFDQMMQDLISSKREQLLNGHHIWIQPSVEVSGAVYFPFTKLLNQDAVKEGENSKF